MLWEVTFSYSLLKKKKKKFAFCLLCFPLLFLHGALGPKGIRFRSRTRRGNVAQSVCSCLHTLHRHNSELILSSVLQTQQRGPCAVSLWKWAELNFACVKRTGLLHLEHPVDGYYTLLSWMMDIQHRISNK